jgi:hypothetical protein
MVPKKKEGATVGTIYIKGYMRFIQKDSYILFGCWDVDKCKRKRDEKPLIKEKAINFVQRRGGKNRENLTHIKKKEEEMFFYDE